MLIKKKVSRPRNPASRSIEQVIPRPIDKYDGHEKSTESGCSFRRLNW